MTQSNIESFSSSQGMLSYRIDRRSNKYVIIFNGTFTDINMRDVDGFFAERDYSVICVARPGYNDSDIKLAYNEWSFEKAVSELMESLNVKEAAVLGISVGGRAAMRFAERYPQKTKQLFLFSSVSFSNWQNRIGSLASKVAFNPIIGKATWFILKSYIKVAPFRGVAFLFSSMTSLNSTEVLKSYTAQSIEGLRGMMLKCSSPRGVKIDLSKINEQGNPELIKVPTVIVHSKYDAAVPLQHPQVLNSAIKESHLVINETESHLMWFSPHWAVVEKKIEELIIN